MKESAKVLKKEMKKMDISSIEVSTLCPHAGGSQGRWRGIRHLGQLFSHNNGLHNWGGIKVPKGFVCNFARDGIAHRSSAKDLLSQQTFDGCALHDVNSWGELFHLDE